MLKRTEVQTLVYLAETTARMHHYEAVKNRNAGRATDTNGHTSPYHKCAHEECALTRRTDLLDQFDDTTGTATDDLGGDDTDGDPARELLGTLHVQFIDASPKPDPQPNPIFISSWDQHVGDRNPKGNQSFVAFRDVVGIRMRGAALCIDIVGKPATEWGNLTLYPPDAERFLAEYTVWLKWMDRN